MVILVVDGPCASVGVQVKTPVDGWMEAPEGAFDSENESVCEGTSGSLAAAVKVRRLPSMTALLPTGVRTGGALDSRTIIEKSSEALNGGEPSSVTRIVSG